MAAAPGRRRLGRRPGVLLLLAGRPCFGAGLGLPRDADQELCEARGGVLVTATLTVQAAAAGGGRDERASACVPRGCAALRGPGCAAARSGILERLLGESASGAEALDAAAGTPSDDGAAQPWFVDGAAEPLAAGDASTYAALRLSGHPAAHDLAPERQRGVLRVAVLGTHAPLTVLAADHLLEVAEVGGLSLEFVFYGQCYLCEKTVGCRELHVPSPADAGCEWFQTAPERDADSLALEAQGAAHHVVRREPELFAVLCLGLLLCHYLFEELPAAALRMQLLCMNPVQGVPEALAGPLLAALWERIEAGEAVLTTNAVTSALVAHHLGRPLPTAPGDGAGVPRAAALFPRDLSELASRLPRRPAAAGAGELLLARSFILLHDPACAAFEAALRQTWPHGVNNQPASWNFGDQEQVAALLRHYAVVYIPEHPYKNLFNEFYSMGLSLLVPSAEFLARMWPRVRHVDADAIYDGWFERRIPRTRLGDAGGEWPEGAPPEPFDLSVRGEAKVLHWMRLADFYHFPGVSAFGGLAQLLQQLSALDAPAVRAQAARHCEEQRRLSLAAFRGFVGRALAAGCGDHQGQAEPPPQPPAGPAAAAAGTDRARPRPPFVACLSGGAGWEVAEEGLELAAWTLRLGARASARARSVRLQVWRPIRVGWLAGNRTSSFQLVGESRVRLRRGGARAPAGRLRAALPPGRRIAVRPGDVPALALDRAALRRSRRGRLARSAGRRPRAGPAQQACAGQRGTTCRSWPQRRVCGFRPSGALTAAGFVGDVGGEFLQAPGPTDTRLLSIAFELPWDQSTFAIWMLEFAAALFADQGISNSVWTFFVCAPAESSGKVRDQMKGWSKVIDIFGAAVGVSLRCGEAESSLEDAVRFLQTVVPHAPWLVLCGDTPSASEEALVIAGSSPAGSGLVLHATDHSSSVAGAACAAPLERRPVAVRGACLLDMGRAGLVHALLQQSLRPPAGPSEGAGASWGIWVFSCLRCLDLGGEEPTRTLNALLSQSQEMLMEPGRFRSLGEVVGMANLRPALDVGRHVGPHTTYEELMTLRQGLSSPDLRLFEDKVQLRQGLLQPLGVAHTPTIYMSNTDPNILPHIAGRQDYVVKPTHMTESENVAVVRGGRHFFDIKVGGKPVGVAGEPVNETLLQSRVLAAWSETAFEWECQAVVSARPGVIVEQIVLATMDPGAPDKSRVEEARCHVVWGRTMAVEWAIGRHGSIVIAIEKDRLGRHTIGTESIWAQALGNDAFADPDGWVANVQGKCLSVVMKQAERVAVGARVDHLRVDFLVEGACDRVYVSEVELFPAVPFGPDTMGAIEQRWRYGYGVG